MLALLLALVSVGMFGAHAWDYVYIAKDTRSAPRPLEWQAMRPRRAYREWLIHLLLRKASGPRR